MNGIDGVLFDKDGTLFDFQASWSTWTHQLIMDLAGDEDARAQRLGAALGFDIDTSTFAPDCPVIAGTPDEIAMRLLPCLPGASLSGLVTRMNMMAGQVQMTPAVPLVPLLTALKRRGLRLGVATNDGEAPARAHLAAAGVLPLLDFVAGFDSGHGGKPQPGMLLAFAAAFALDPRRVLMVGDSAHDLIAGQAAGMRTLGVLTGPARAATLAPLAEAVLPDIGDLPGWLDTLMLAETSV